MTCAPTTADPTPPPPASPPPPWSLDARPAVLAQAIAHGRPPRGRRARPRTAVLAAAAGLAAVLLLAIAIEVRSDEPGPEDVAATLTAAHLYIAAVNAHDPAGLHELLRPDLVFHETASGATQDRTGFLEWARVVGEAYPSFAIAVDHIASDGVRATVRYQAAAPNGSRAPTTFVIRVEHGRIAEMWSDYGEFGLHRGVAERGAAPGT